MSDDQLPLFNDGRRTPPQVRPPVPAMVTYTRISSSEWCDDCIADAHAHGMVHTPFPRMRRWRRTDRFGQLGLCDGHKRKRQASDV